MPEPCAQLDEYVLGVLEPPARRAFEAHLLCCAACAREEEALRPVRDGLALAVPHREPPTHLRASVLAEVRREAALLSSVAPAPPRRRRRWRLAWPGLAAAATAAAAALAIVGSEDPRTVPAIGARGSGTLELAGGEAARLRVRDLPSPGRGRVYQVWIQPEGAAPRPTTALFDVPRAGATTVAVPGRLRSGDLVLVTSEPRGGSRRPSRAPVLQARV